MTMDRADFAILLTQVIVGLASRLDDDGTVTMLGKTYRIQEIRTVSALSAGDGLFVLFTETSGFGVQWVNKSFTLFGEITPETEDELTLLKLAVA